MISTDQLASPGEFDAPRILGALGDALFVLDGETMIHSVNASASALLERSEESLRDRNFESIIADSDYLALVGVKYGLGRTVQRNMNIVLQKGDGDFIPVNATVAPLLSAAGDPYGYVLSCRDARDYQESLSEQNRAAVAAKEMARREADARGIAERRAQEQLELGQKRKLEAIGHLAAGIAHEMNTPIQFVGDNIRFVHESFDALMQFIERCSDLLEAASDDQGRTLEKIVEGLREVEVDYLRQELPAAFAETLDGVQRVAKIVAAMKNFSYPDVGVRQFEDLHQAIDTMVTVSQSEWKHVARLELDLCPDMPPVPCYADELKQVILNLIVNAAHAISEAQDERESQLGTIRIATRCDASTAQIAVSDTGTGMDETTVERIFDPFFTTKEVGRGTGQGLSLAHAAVVTRHGGDIEVRSELGRGTTVTLKLPLGTTSIVPESAGLP
ncbi:MAG: ATP-binding protein [Myxococcales bacterium]|nr:ATP-binding protein [Myxococcales bacterium]